MDDSVLTVSEVADKLKLSASTVYHFVNEGKIPGMKIGKQWRITNDAISSFLQSGMKSVEITKE